MGQFIPAFVSVLKGGTIAKGAGIAVKTAANAALMVMRENQKTAFKTLAKYLDGRSMTPDFELNGFSPYDNSWVQELTPADKARKKMADQSVQS